MENESQLDLFLLSLYNSSTTDRLQTLATKFVPTLLNCLNPEKKLDQKKVVKTINDTLVFFRKHEEIIMPFEELVEIIENSKITLQKNIGAIFLKMTIQNHPDKVNLQLLMNTYNKIPSSIQQIVLTAYINQNNRMDPVEFVKTLNDHIDAIGKLSKDELKIFPQFVSSYPHLFKNYSLLFITIFMKFDNIDIIDGSVLNQDEIAQIIQKQFASYNQSQVIRSLYLLSKINSPFPLDKIIADEYLPFVLECLDKQVPLHTAEEIEPLINKIMDIATSNLSVKSEIRISIVRTLMRKCHHHFVNNLELFKLLFNSDEIYATTKSSIIYLFSSFINPSPQLMKFLEEKIFDGEVTALAILRFIYPFKEPRTKVIGCVMISDGNFADECRILLSPYSLTESKGFRTCRIDDKAEPPLTSDIFKVIESSPKIHNFLTNSSSTRNVSALFNFACICKPSPPIPFQFIISELNNCPNSANEISNFLVHIAKALPKTEDLDLEPLLNYIEKESDPFIIESISSFLEWTGSKFDVEKVASKMDGAQKVAFLGHFGFPFDECVKMLTTVGQSNLGKKSLMAMAKRGLLDKSHFDKLFPMLSKDAVGVEILSIIAASDVGLCEQLTTKFFESPLVNSEHVEVIVSAARKLSKIVSEDFLMNLIDTGMKTDKPRRNSSIFLLYLVDALKEAPKRLWFVTRTLLFCSGAENGVVRTAGLIGLNILYRKLDDSKKKEVDDALLGRSKPEGENAQLMSGQHRAQLIQTLLKLAPKIPDFLDFLNNLIEPDFIIFSDIEIPECFSKTSGNQFASKFFYLSFSTDETMGHSFRKLWRWATDGGKKISIPELIDAVDENPQSWDDQQMNLSCVLEIISRMSQEQSFEYFDRLSKSLLKLVFSPVNEISVSAIGTLNKLVQKLGQYNLPPSIQSQVMSLCAQIFDTRLKHLVVFATQWANDLIPAIESISNMIVIYEALFNGLGSSTGIPDMLSGPTWPVFSKAVYRCCELEIGPFLTLVRNQVNSMIVLDSQRYASLYSLDSIVRSPQRSLIANEVNGIVPSLFTLLSNEKSDSIILLLTNLIVHSLQCIAQGTGEEFDIIPYLYRLFFEDEKYNICGSLVKAIALFCPDYLEAELSPFIVFGGSFDDNCKEFQYVLRDEIPLSVQVNSNPHKFIDFAFERGISFEKQMYKPIGSRMLLTVVKVMTDETKARESEYLLSKILPTLAGRLFPSKECLIDAICELIGHFTIEKSFVDQIESAAMRPKSVFRAAAINVLQKICSLGSYNIDKTNLIKIMCDAMTNGTIVAQVAAAKCAPYVKDESGFADFIEKTYSKMNDLEHANADAFCSIVLNLPEHEIPNVFDRAKFMKLVSLSKDKTANINTFLEKLQ